MTDVNKAIYLPMSTNPNQMLLRYIRDIKQNLPIQQKYL